MNLASAPVRLSRRFRDTLRVSRGSRLITAGNRVKAVASATATPIIIIQPKVMMGRMPLTTSEPKATAVVRAV